MNIKRTAAILFGGIGGFSAGLKRSKVEAYGNVYEYEILCSIDFDPTACKNHDLITGDETAVQMDLFSRDQYTKWFGEEPPEDWREVTPWDVWQASGVSFFFKQHGEFAVGRRMQEIEIPGYLEEARDGIITLTTIDPPVEAGKQRYVAVDKENRAFELNRVGKKAAGRMLDDREWNEYPQKV